MKTKNETVRRVLVANEDFVTRNGQSEERIQCNGYALLISGRYPNGKDFYDDCRQLKPDIIVSDMFLDEIDLLTMIKKFNSNYFYPTIIAIGPKNQVFVDMALNNGCRYYMSGNVNNDSILNNIRLLVETEIHTADAAKGMITTSEYVDGVVENILLQDFGVPYSINGFVLLRDAIAYVVKAGEDNITNIGITKVLYPEIAKKHGTTPSRVERNIRTAIEKACNNAGFNTLEKYFGKSWNESRVSPTNTQFICTVSRRIHSEYTVLV